MITLIHEDIYVYVDKIEENIQTLSGANNFALTNNSTQSIVDKGLVEIVVNSGSYTGLTLSDGTNTLTITKPLPTGSLIEIDLRNNSYKVDGSLFLFDTVLELKDDFNNALNLVITGTGTATVKYKRNLVVVNNNDLYFCTGLDVSQENDVVYKTNIKGEIKLRKGEKKTFKFGINGLWNETELDKFESGSGMFRLRLVDEDGVELEKLVNCVIASFQKGSSDGGDYTYSLNGSCEKIF